MNINIILRCLIQNSTEDAILARWKDALSSANGARDESFSAYVSKTYRLELYKIIILLELFFVFYMMLYYVF
jgi:hypothetical protein